MMKKFVKKIAIKPAALAAPPTSRPKEKPTKRIKADDLSSTNNSTPYTLKADNNLADYGIAELPNLEYEPPLKKIIGMKITWLTSREIESMATFVVNSSKTTGEGSVYDPRSGTITNYEKCVICSLDWRQCPGHPGVIKFPYPIPHPMRLKQLAEYLTCVCEFCHRLVLSWKQMKTLGILRYRGENRYKAYLDTAKKIARCKNCFVEGTPVSLLSGISVPIETLRKADRLWSRDAKEDGIVAASVTDFMDMKEKKCIELTLEDGRTIICTPDHEILTSAGDWVEADNLIGRRVQIGPDNPLHKAEITDWKLECGGYIFDGISAKSLAFARIIGYLITDGHISSGKINNNILLGYQLDVDRICEDLQMITGENVIGRFVIERNTWEVHIPNELSRAISSLEGVTKGRQIGQEGEFPQFILDIKCPLAIVREFLGGLFGGDGLSPGLYESNGKSRVLGVGFCQSKATYLLPRILAVFGQLQGLLTLFGITNFTVQVRDDKKDTRTIVMRMTPLDAVKFNDLIGFRYCAHKSQRLLAISSYYRMYSKVASQRKRIAIRANELIGLSITARAVRAAHPEIRGRLQGMKMSRARAINQAGSELLEREFIIHDSALPNASNGLTSALDMDETCYNLCADGFPTAKSYLKSIGADKFFTDEGKTTVDRSRSSLPPIHLKVIDIRPVGVRHVYDISVDDPFNSFVANGVVVHNCRKPHGKYTVVDDKFFKVYKKKSEVKKIPISYDEVVEIISNIREKEFQLLGFTDPLCHPKHIIIYNLLVIPIGSRPFVESNQNMMHDDLTHKYIEIEKVVTKLSEKGLSEKGKLDLMDSLMFHVKTLMDNGKNKARDPNGKRPLKAIKQRVCGKGGHVRQNIQGKRVTHCLPGDTLVNISSGLSIRLDQTDQITSIFGFNEKSKSLTPDDKIAFLDQGEQECFELTFQDGSTLTATDKHSIMLNRGWTEMKDIQPGMMVKKSIEFPVYNPVEELDEKWSLEFGSLRFSSGTIKEYERSLAFCRLLGIILTNGSIWYQKRDRVIRSNVSLGCLLDVKMIVEDIFMLTGKRPIIGDCESKGQDSRKTFKVNIPTILSRQFEHLDVCIGRRVSQVGSLPKFILDPKCPKGLVREFLGGLFGGDGRSPNIDKRNVITSIGFSQSKLTNHLESGKRMMLDISKLLARFDITKITLPKEQYYHTPKRNEEICTITLHISIEHLVHFTKQIGFRYCLDKQLKATVVSSYLSMQQKIRNQANELRQEPNKIPIPSLPIIKVLFFVAYTKNLGISEWFHSYAMNRDRVDIPSFNTMVIHKRSVGIKKVYDITMKNTHSFTANGVVVHNCGRSVISPDPYLHVNEVGVPQEIADKLTFPETVCTFNMEWCQKLFDANQVNRIKRGDEWIDATRVLYTRGFKLQYGDVVLRRGVQITPTFFHSFKIELGDAVIRTEQIELPDGSVEMKRALIKNVEPPKRKYYKLRIGDIAERKLINGDFCLLNRQPTLHEPSIRAKKIRIHPWRTIRFGLACTGAFGADFDGDEMNLHIAQSQAARAECQYLMSTAAQFISSADSKPILGMKQDAMVGGYLYTLGTVKIDKEDFMDACCTVDNWNEYGRKSDAGDDESGISRICEKMEYIRQVHKWTGMYDIEVERLKSELDVKEAQLKRNRAELKRYKIEHATVQPRYKYGVKLCFDTTKRETLELKRYIAYMSNETNFSEAASDNLLYTGHGLLSMLNPDDFQYKYDNKMSPDGKPINIIRGVMVSGTFNKVALMNMIHHMYKDYGAHFGCDYVTYYQRFMNTLLERRGFSVGLEDYTPNPRSTELIHQEQTKCFLQAKTVMETEPDLEVREAKVLGILNTATDIGERIIREGLSKNNNVIHMILSGAKGSMFNYVNSVNSVGQQNLGGQRAPKNYGGRTLPCYKGTPGSEYAPDEIPVNDVLSEFENLTRLFGSRGNIKSSFYEGLTAPEFFFLSAGGREGLIDTSVKTARCGYITRRLLKKMEDIKVAYNGMVVSSKGTVVQFCYGDDNLSAAELIKTEKFGNQCADINHIADMLNSEAEWEQYEATLPQKIKPVKVTPAEVDEWDGCAY